MKLITKRLCLIASILLTLSCNFKSNNKKEIESNQSVEKKTRYLDSLKIYEPKKYKGQVPKDFYTYFGAFDWYRYPLVYPYSICCVDVTDYGNIFSDEGVNDLENASGHIPLAFDFDKFIFNDKYFIGKKSKGFNSNDTTKFEKEYFIFSFQNGSKKEIKDKVILKEKMKEIGFNRDTVFMTINEYGRKL